MRSAGSRWRGSGLAFPGHAGRQPRRRPADRAARRLAGSSGRRTRPLRLFLAVGVLGGFTTFSAFSLEMFAMIAARRARPRRRSMRARSVVGSIAAAVRRPLADAGAGMSADQVRTVHRRATRMTASASTAGSGATCPRRASARSRAGRGPASSGSTASAPRPATGSRPARSSACRRRARRRRRRHAAPKRDDAERRREPNSSARW